MLYFSKFFAPFVEIDCCSPIEIRRGETALKQDRDFDPRDAKLMHTITSRPDGRFFDFDDYIYFRLDDPPKWHEVFTLRFPIRARIEAIAALWLFAIAAIFLHRRNVRFLLNPSPRMALRGAAAAAGLLGATLLAINVAGLFSTLRNAEVDRPSPETLRVSYGPEDTTVTWQAARSQLGRAPGESKAGFADRLTVVVAQSVMHLWYQRYQQAFRLHVPVWENYILWLAGELFPNYRLYVFADPYKAIERGTGMCDQVSVALTTLLRWGGLDARVVQLNGHTVVTAEVDADRWMVLDADFNVVIPRSIQQIQADPKLVRPYYSAALAKLDPKFEKFPADMSDRIVSYYASDNFIEPAYANTALGIWRVQFERLAYRLKWPLPFVLLGLSALTLILTSRRIRFARGE